MDKAVANPRFIFITDYLRETVTDSAIVSWLEQFEKKGQIFDIVMPCTIVPYIKEKHLQNTKIAEAQKKISGKFYRIPVLKFGQILLCLSLLWLFRKEIVSGRTIVAVKRGPTYLSAFKLLKAVYPKLYIILDLRGAGAEEFILSRSKQPFVLSYRPLKLCKNILLKSDYLSRWLYQKKLAEELNFIKLSDHTLCVSRKLKDYVLDKGKTIEPEKITVIPGSASVESFFFNETVRNNVREKLKITKKFVFVYSGRLDKAWQMPDFIFNIFSKLVSKNPNFFLLCLTPNKNLAHKYATAHNIPEENIWADYVKYAEINNYLCAGDAGLLFREDTPTNNVASPTKFAEYCMAGLPVVISNGVGDFSDFVKVNNIGLIVNNESNNLINEIENKIVNSTFDKSRIAEIGKCNFSKESNVDLFLKIYAKYCQ